MNKRKSWIMKTFMTLGIIMLIWLVFAQSCMQFRISDAEAVKQFAAANTDLTLKDVKVNGHNLHYAKTGSDSLPTIIFVHGSPGSWDAFAGYMKDPDLLQDFRMISIDRPGFGLSDFGEAQNLATQSALISPLFQLWKNGKPMYLVGHSLGGPLIIKLAADNKNMFDALVLLAGSVDPREEKKEGWRPVFFKTPLKFFVPGAFRPSNEELWYLKKDLRDLKNDFPQIRGTVYIIHGNKDDFVPVGNAEYARKMLVNAKKIEVTILDGANHFIPWSRYDQIKKVLMKLN